MKDGEEAVGLLLDALNGLSLNYMVVGSFSSNRYGVPRATKDADFVLHLVSTERERLFSILPDGFILDPQVSFEMVTGTAWRQIIQIPEIPFTIELFELSAMPTTAAGLKDAGSSRFLAGKHGCRPRRM